MTEVYRKITGANKDTLDAILQYIEESDVLSYDFQSKVPVSLKMLVSGTNAVVQNGIDINVAALIEVYISTFVFAGKEIMNADYDIPQREISDFEFYIKNMIAYVYESSYARFDEPLTNLLNC